MSLLGFNAIGRLALGQIRQSTPMLFSVAMAGVGAVNMTGASAARSAMSAAGIAAMSLTGIVIARFAASLTGVGACAAGSKASALAKVTLQGNSAMGALDLATWSASFSGVGTLSAVGYMLVLDAEKAGPVFEQRTAYEAVEFREAVARFEDRVYYAPSKPLVRDPPNRKRTL
jgi:hypothetical protein